MTQRIIFPMVLFLCVLSFQAGLGQTLLTEWNDYTSNPVFDPASRAYYPTVLYDVNAFSGHGASFFYKMWYDSPTPIMLAGSNDGISWTVIGTTTGLKDARHARIIYNLAGFGGGIFYKIWYWDSVVSIYSINALRYAESADGMIWTNDQVLTQDPLSPIVTGTYPDWNTGTYGPMYVLFNPSALNTGTNPFNYSYTMYYDGTTGAIEQVGLAYSIDGKLWSLHSKVLSLGALGVWDDHYACYGTVLYFDGLWHMWYSGGQNEMGTTGIGYATSPDGITWTKYAANPLTSLGGYGTFGGMGPAGSWNEKRNYTPMVLYDANKFSGHGEACEFKMWRSGVSASGNYSVGYASVCLPSSPAMPTKHRPSYSLRPLAQSSIGVSDGMKTEVENLLKLAEERGLDTTQCKSFYEKGLSYLGEAKKFLQGNNPAAANTYAIYADKELKKALDCLKALIS
jgi:hypothetical protein